MQVRSPTSSPACRIGLDDDDTVVVLDRDNPEQLGGRRTLPATHTGSHWSRTTDHRESLP